MKFEPPSDLDTFCAPTRQCESDSIEIKNLAEDLTKNCKNKEEAATILFKWVRDNVAWRIEKTVGAKKVLLRKPMYGICTDKSSLFIALCRSIEIPARYVIADIELKDVENEDVRKLKYHVEAEVFLKDKWVLADPTFGKHTEKIVPVSKFGEPPWNDAKNVKRTKEISSIFVFFSNLFIKIQSSSKRLKNAIEVSKSI
jgi:transglutaminase-like putative cysteine protease